MMSPNLISPGLADRLSPAQEVQQLVVNSNLRPNSLINHSLTTTTTTTTPTHTHHHHQVDEPSILLDHSNPKTSLTSLQLQLGLPLDDVIPLLTIPSPLLHPHLHPSLSVIHSTSIPNSTSSSSRSTSPLDPLSASASMSLSFRSISTDRRHIDPNPDRLPTPPSATSRLVSASLPASSLLLLSTSAEAAVLESRKFERGSRPSSVNSISHPPKLAAVLGTRRPSQQQQRVHHRLAEAVASTAVVSVKRDPKNPHIFKCEKCPKVYRHPQCLVKHRWEHTSYWADASKLMLSKHQQVQMLEAAAILATPSGSLPESRSLWPAAVSPSEAGLLGSDQVNLDVIQSKSRPMHRDHRSSSSPCSSVLTGSTPTAVSRNRASEDIDMHGGTDEEDDDAVDETGDEADEDEIMFEMSINGDDSQSASSAVETASGGKRSPGAAPELACLRSGPINFSVSAPPPMGYFEPRSKMVTKLDPKPDPPTAFVAYPNRRTSSICSVSKSYYNPDTVFNPPPYADSGLRFQGTPSLLDQTAATSGEDDDEEDEDEGFGIREVGMNCSGDEVVGMEL